MYLTFPDNFWLLSQAIKNGEVVSDFRGVGLGDSWISPMDSVNTWGTFLYQMVSAIPHLPLGSAMGRIPYPKNNHINV